MRIRKVLTVVGAFALLCAPGAFAVVLTPSGAGSTGIPTNFDLSGDFTGGTLVTSSSPAVTITPSGSNLAGSFNVGVYREAGGTLDFLYQFDPTGSFLQTLSMNNFLAQLGTIDAGFVTSNIFGGVFASPTTGNVCGQAMGNASCNPNNVSWSPTTVSFSFQGNEVMSSSVPANHTGLNQNSDILVLRTNATIYSTGFTQAIDGGTATADAFQPGPEPGSVGLLLGALFGIGLFVARRFQVREN